MLAIVAATPDTAAQEFDLGIAAVVNDDAISAQDVAERLRLALVASGVEPSAAAQRQLMPQVLRSMIDEKLQMQEAERLGVGMEPNAVEDALVRIAERNNMDVPTMVGFLAQNGITERTLREQVEAQGTWLQIVSREIRPRVLVTEDQIDLAVQEFRRAKGSPEYLLSEIVLPVYDPEQEAAVAQSAADLYRALLDGASFEAFARQLSASASAGNGGDLGWVVDAAVPRELRSVIEALNAGDLSQPVRTPVGYYIFWMRDRRLSTPDQSAGQRVSLAQVLYPRSNQPDDGEITQLREQALADRESLVSCDAVQALAEERQAPQSGMLGWVRLGDLPPGIAEPVNGLEVGEISPPLESPIGLHLVMVCEREGAEEESLRAQVAEELEREQTDRLTRRYLRDLRKDAFIDVRI